MDSTDTRYQTDTRYRVAVAETECPHCNGRLFNEDDIRSRGISRYWACVNCGRQYTVHQYGSKPIRCQVTGSIRVGDETVAIHHPRLPALAGT